MAHTASAVKGEQVRGGDFDVSLMSLSKGFISPHKRLTQPGALEFPCLYHQTYGPISPFDKERGENRGTNRGKTRRENDGGL